MSPPSPDGGGESSCAIWGCLTGGMTVSRLLHHEELDIGLGSYTAVEAPFEEILPQVGGDGD